MLLMHVQAQVPIASLASSPSSLYKPTFPSPCLSYGQRKYGEFTIFYHLYSSLRPPCNKLAASFRTPGQFRTSRDSHSPSISIRRRMSQPYDFIDLTSMDLESFTPTQLNQLLNTADTGSPVQPFIKSEPTNDLDFDFFNSYPLPIDSQASTLLTTSDLLGYDLDQTSSGYPTPGPSTPQPYIFEQQQCHNPILAVDLPYRRRPQAFRSQTNT